MGAECRYALLAREREGSAAPRSHIHGPAALYPIALQRSGPRAVAARCKCTSPGRGRPRLSEAAAPPRSRGSRPGPAPAGPLCSTQVAAKCGWVRGTLALAQGCGYTYTTPTAAARPSQRRSPHTICVHNSALLLSVPSAPLLPRCQCGRPRHWQCQVVIVVIFNFWKMRVPNNV